MANISNKIYVFILRSSSGPRKNTRFFLELNWFDTSPILLIKTSQGSIANLVNRALLYFNELYLHVSFHAYNWQDCCHLLSMVFVQLKMPIVYVVHHLVSNYDVVWHSASMDLLCSIRFRRRFNTFFYNIICFLSIYYR